MHYFDNKFGNQQIMLYLCSMEKQVLYTEDQVKQMFMDFYDKVKHGDQEHQDWLLDETKKYLQARLVDKMTAKVVFLDFSKNG